MSTETCCGNPQHQWAQKRDQDKWADELSCAACGHVFASEMYFLPVRWPETDRCVNCGGVYVPDGKRQPKCEKCGLTAAHDKEVHETLASAHPEKSMVKGADVARQLGRHVLALKLATAATRWGPAEDGPVARRIRVESLASLGKAEQALDEVYDWANNGGAPPWVWQTIAAIEGETGNVEAMLNALRFGVQVDPLNADMWANFAECNLVVSEWGRAVDAARRTMDFPGYEQRAMDVLAEAGNAIYAEGYPADAKVAAMTAGKHLERSAALMWLLARMAEEERDLDTARDWLQKVLALEPEHAEAKAMWETIKKPEAPKKAGWLPW